MVSGKVYAIGLIIIILAIIASCLAVYFRQKDSQEKSKERGWATKGDLSALQERRLIGQNEHAAHIFRQILAPPDSLTGDMTLLTPNHKDLVESWLRSQMVISTEETKRGISYS